MSVEKNFQPETRVYAGGKTYTPLAPHERKNGVNRPDDPRAVRFHALWFLPLELVPDKERKFPPTRPDTDAYDHMETNILCHCDVCIRPQAERWRARWRRHQGLRG